MARRPAACALIVAIGAAFGLVHAAPDVSATAAAREIAAAPLAMDTALQLAQQRSQQLLAQDAAASAAREMAVAAAQRPDPLLRAGLVNVPVEGPERFSTARDFMTMRSISLMQELPREAKRRARAARYEREAEAAQAGRALALVNLRRDTALAWLERHFAERMLELLRAQRAETALQADAADAALRGGRGMAADAVMARAALAQVDERIVMTQAQRDAATTMLARWIGAEAAARPLAAPPPLEAAPLADGQLHAQLERHPELVLMARREALSQAEADIAERNREADWSVELMFSQRGSSYSNMVSFNVAVPLQWDRPQRQDRELAARRAMAAQMGAEREELARAHAAETQAWLQQWQGLRERVLRYDTGLIPLAAERTRAALAAYRGGGTPLAAVLEARRMEIDVRMERLRLEMDAAALWARLAHLVPPEAEGDAVPARVAGSPGPMAPGRPTPPEFSINRAPAVASRQEP